MTEPILVTGGTGDIGRRVVRLLRASDRDVRTLSRRGGLDAPGVEHLIGDTRKDEGLDAAFAGAPVVLHLAGGPTGDDTSAQHVVAAARRAGTQHLVLVSVIGAGAVPIGYVRRKASAERTVTESGIPFTILRAAQLQSLLRPVIETMSRLPLALAPRDVRVEPVDGDTVAERLVELALGPAAGRVPDVAGPDVIEMYDLVAHALASRGRRRHIVRIPVPGAIGRAYRSGANLADETAVRGGRSWFAPVANP